MLLLLIPLAASAEQAAKPSPYWDGFNFNAEQGDRYYLIVSPYTTHFSPSEEHEYVWLAGFERERSSGDNAGDERHDLRPQLICAPNCDCRV